MKTLVFTLTIGFALSFSNHTKSAETSGSIRTYGVKINVTDMDKALAFYCDQVGFEIESKADYPQMVWLKLEGGTKFVLNKVSNLVPERTEDTRAAVCLQVNNLDEAIRRMKEKGIDFGDTQKRKEGVGYAMTILDPFGTRISMMHVTVVQSPVFQEPAIYNYGFTVSDMDAARAFYCEKLGFKEMSQKYLPLDMPLIHADKKFAFMLHYREGVEGIYYNTANDEHTVLLFQTDDLEKAMKNLQAKDVKFIQKKPQQSALGKYISFRDPSGCVSELIEIK